MTVFEERVVGLLTAQVVLLVGIFTGIFAIATW